MKKNNLPAEVKMSSNVKTIKISKENTVKEISVKRNEHVEIFLEIAEGGEAKINLEENSHLEIFVKTGNLTSGKLKMKFVLGKNACAKIISCNFGAVEEETEILQKGEGSRCEHFAVGFAQGKQRIHKKIDHIHIGEKTYSRTRFKYIATDFAQVDLSGKVVIEETGKNTDTHLLLKGLSLSGEALLKLVPLLNVYNNNVTAGHGAASATLGENELFYMQSRGIEKKEAVQLAAEGFLEEILELGKFNESIAKRVSEEIGGVIR